MRDRWRMGVWFAERVGYLMVGMVLAGLVDRADWTMKRRHLEQAQGRAIAEMTQARQALDVATATVFTTFTDLVTRQGSLQRSLDTLTAIVTDLDEKVEDAFTLFRRVPWPPPASDLTAP